MSCEISYSGEYFTLYEVADGVYAAIEKEKKAGSNAGFIDLGDRTVIFDAFLDIDAARELQRISQEITGRDASLVVNSHSHADHIIGNCVFPSNSFILSSKPARMAIDNTKSEYESERHAYPAQIEKALGRLETELSASEKMDLENELLYLNRLCKPDVSIRLPDVTIDSNMMLYGPGNEVSLRVHEMAHSAGDVIAVLPARKVCFMGDLLFTGRHPWLGRGDPEKLAGILREMAAGDYECFVPGHGILASREDVLLQIQYIEEIRRLVNDRGSADEKDYSLEDLSPVFQEQNSLCFRWNIRYLIGKSKKD